MSFSVCVCTGGESVRHLAWSLKMICASQLIWHWLGLVINSVSLYHLMARDCLWVGPCLFLFKRPRLCQLKQNGYVTFKILRPERNVCHFGDNILKYIFLKKSLFIIGFNFTEVCSYGFKWQDVIIGLGNGLAPHRQQAIYWTNNDPTICLFMVELDHSELTRSVLSHSTNILSFKSSWPSDAYICH